MSITIKVDQYDSDNGLLFKKEEFIFDPGITILVGCNGSGKTTLMKQIESKYGWESINGVIAKKFSCCDTENEISRIMQFGSNKDSIHRATTMIFSSEGERITQGLVSAFNWMWNECRNSETTKIFMLLDSLDSGLDVVNIRMIRDVLTESAEIVKNDFKKELFVILSANDYALVEGCECLDIYEGERVTFKDWNDYLAFVTRSSVIKETRYDEESNSNENEQDYDSWSER